MLYKRGMEGRSLEKGAVLPEKLVAHLLCRLRRHGLWDSILVVFSPLLAFFYLGFFLLRSGWIASETLIFSLAAGLGVALALIFYYGRTPASMFSAARLIDDRVEGKDRFITLVTVNPSLSPSFLVTRLRDEARGLLRRISLRRDFPYRVKRTFPLSLAGSLAVVLLFHLLWQTALFSSPREPFGEDLAVLAQRLSQVPHFSQLARGLNELAVRMQEQDLSSTEKRSLIQQLLSQIEDQLGREESDLLSQAANALRGLKKRQGQGGAGQKMAQPDEREGKGKGLAKAGGEERRDELTAQRSKGIKGGRSPQDEREKTGRGEGESGGGDRLSREMGGTVKEQTEGRRGKSKQEEIPRGRTPERFLKPGEEGEKGIKGARFVIVELPEGEEAASISGTTGGRGRSARPKVPVSNVPLPPSTGPDAPRERQLVPLEYRELIR